MYRDAGASAHCSSHPAAQAVTTCRGCLQAVCEVCLVYVGTDPHCPKCARSRKRARLAATATAVGLTLAVLGGGIGWLAVRKARLADAPVKSAKDAIRFADREAMRAKLDATPCAHQLALDYAKRLLRDNDARGAITFIDGFWQKCGDWPRLRWTRYTAHKELGELDAAVEDATLLIKSRPDDQDFWWWRGQAREKQQKLDLAIADFRQAHLLLPSGNYIPFDLSKLLDDQGRPCESLSPIEGYLYHHPDQRDGSYVASRLRRLEPMCPGFYGTGLATVRLDDDNRSKKSKATINGVQITASLHSAESFTLITEALAQRLGLPAGGQRLSARGIEGRHVVLDAVAWDRAAARHIDAVIVPEIPGPGDAILGQTFLSHFATALDYDRLTLAAREP